MRSGADQGHLPAQDIEELRKFIDARPAQPAADWRDPLVIADRLSYLRTMFHHGHRSEFEDPEFLSVETIAKLREKNGPARVELDHDSSDQHGWRQHDKRQAGKCNIERPLEGAFAPCQRTAVQVDDPRRSDLRSGLV